MKSPELESPSVRISEHVFVLPGAVNTGVLISEGYALLLDCCDTVTPERLSEMGAHTVEMILCTQHRRPNVAGAYAYVSAGAQLVVPKDEKHLFDAVETYWEAPVNRWHLYHHQPGPQVLPRSIDVSRSVSEGDVVEWRGFRIAVLDTPGATDGSVSYVLAADDASVCFCGDALCGPGKIPDLYSLQKGTEGLLDYHGFIGNRAKLVPSLRKLSDCSAGILVPSQGEPIRDPLAAVSLVIDRLDALWRNYAAISSLRYYFPAFMPAVQDDPERMSPAKTMDLPDFVRRVAVTSFAVVSEDGSALVTDCMGEALHTIRTWLEEGVIKTVEACWVTHYHDDHVDQLADLVEECGCEIVADQHVAQIIEKPSAYFLPCISPNSVHVDRTTRDRESWKWHEFELTAFHLPGQTFYHGGLLVERGDCKVLFAGDSGSPTGIDDHCCGNRNFLGKGKGFRKWIDLLRDYRPDFILNSHQDRPFWYTDDQLDHMEMILEKREDIFRDILPWEHHDFGADENWVRAYPFEQCVEPGSACRIDLEFTNHGSEEACAGVEPVLPEGWTWGAKSAELRVPPETSGTRQVECENPDGAVSFVIAVPEGVASGRYVVPFRVTWRDRYLGQFRHAVIVVGRAE